MLAGSFLFFFLIALVIYLFLWPVTQQFAFALLAWCLGIGMTVGLKYILTLFCRKASFRSFMRVRPRAANVSNIMLETWYLGLGGGVLVARMSQFLFAAAFWIGRIDEPFLADNVEIFGYQFDYLPVNFQKDILVHEAHRHPFIERLGAMYLMRLKYPTFGNPANAVWRQLLLVAIMPWMLKYRVFYEARLEAALKDQRVERQLSYEESKGVIEVALEQQQEFFQELESGAMGIVNVGEHVVDKVIGKREHGNNDEGISSREESNLRRRRSQAQEDQDIARNTISWSMSKDPTAQY